MISITLSVKTIDRNNRREKTTCIKKIMKDQKNLNLSNYFVPIFRPEASCPNVGQEWGAKHSTLFKFATRFIFYIFDEYVFSVFENMGTSLLTISKFSELRGNLTKVNRNT